MQVDKKMHKGDRCAKGCGIVLSVDASNGRLQCNQSHSKSRGKHKSTHSHCGVDSTPVGKRQRALGISWDGRLFGHTHQLQAHGNDHPRHFEKEETLSGYLTKVERQATATEGGK